MRNVRVLRCGKVLVVGATMLKWANTQDRWTRAKAPPGATFIVGRGIPSHRILRGLPRRAAIAMHEVPHGFRNGPNDALMVQREIWNSLDRNRTYWHPMLAFTPEQLECVNYNGMPINVEHLDRVTVGATESAWVDQDKGDLRVLHWVDRATELGRGTVASVANGSLSGMSVDAMHFRKPDSTEWDYTVFNHFALCNEPYYTGCTGLEIQASRKGEAKDGLRIITSWTELADLRCRLGLPTQLELPRAPQLFQLDGAERGGVPAQGVGGKVISAAVPPNGTLFTITPGATVDLTAGGGCLPPEVRRRVSLRKTLDRKRIAAEADKVEQGLGGVGDPAGNTLDLLRKFRSVNPIQGVSLGEALTKGTAPGTLAKLIAATPTVDRHSSEATTEWKPTPAEVPFTYVLGDRTREGEVRDHLASTRPPSLFGRIAFGAMANLAESAGLPAQLSATDGHMECEPTDMSTPPPTIQTESIPPSATAPAPVVMTQEQMQRERDLIQRERLTYEAQQKEMLKMADALRTERSAIQKQRIGEMDPVLLNEIESDPERACAMEAILANPDNRYVLDMMCSWDTVFKQRGLELVASQKAAEKAEAERAAYEASMTEMRAAMQTSEAHASGLYSLAMRSPASVLTASYRGAVAEEEEPDTESAYVPAGKRVTASLNPLTHRFQEGSLTDARRMFMRPGERGAKRVPNDEVDASSGVSATKSQRLFGGRKAAPEEVEEVDEDHSATHSRPLPALLTAGRYSKAQDLGDTVDEGSLLMSATRNKRVVRSTAHTPGQERGPSAATLAAREIIAGSQSIGLHDPIPMPRHPSQQGGGGARRSRYGQEW